MNDIFSSRDFEAKFDRSRKLSVEIERDEKKGCEGKDDGPGRLCGCRVINAFNRSLITESQEGEKNQWCVWKELTSQIGL